MRTLRGRPVRSPGEPDGAGPPGPAHLEGAVLLHGQEEERVVSSVDSARAGPLTPSPSIPQRLEPSRHLHGQATYVWIEAKSHA